MKTYFLADMHLGHKNILAYDNRPFTTIEEHDQFIMDAWLKTVNPEDRVYILGDVSWHSSVKTAGFLNELPGKKVLITGNHDLDHIKNHGFCSCFEEITPYKELHIEGANLVLTHYPMICFNGSYGGAWQFYGHTHKSFEENIVQSCRRQIIDLYGKPCNMVNIGVMMDWINYTPRTFDEIVDNAAKLNM